jgi:hypothetical protein
MRIGRAEAIRPGRADRARRNSRGLIDSPTRQGQATYFVAFQGLSSLGCGGINRTVVTDGLACSSQRRRQGLQPWSTVFRAFEVGTFLPVGPCSTAVRLATRYDKEGIGRDDVVPLGERRRGGSMCVANCPRLFGHQSGGSLWRRWRLKR